MTKNGAYAKYKEYCARRESLLAILLKVRKPDRLFDESIKRWDDLDKKHQDAALADWIDIRARNGHAPM